MKKLQETQPTKSDPSLGWLYNPADFALKAFNWPEGRGPTDYQLNVLRMLPEKRRVSVRGPHGLGKTSISAITVLWFALTRDAAGLDWKVVTTAGAWRQLQQYLWPEIRKWARLLNWEILGREPFDERQELLTLSLKLKCGSAFAVASDQPELIEGAHADSILYIFDESKAIVTKTFEAAEGAFSGAAETGIPEAFALAMSTPGEPNGFFYDIHCRREGLEDWWAYHVTLQDAIAAGRVAEGWAEKRRLQWGEGSAVYRNRVLGEFHSSDEDGVIPLAWVDAAIERWKAWDESGRPEQDGLKVIGVDVARGGEDTTVQALRHGVVVSELRKTSKEDTMATAGRVEGVLRSRGGQAVVDVIGIGAGVVDKLREDRMNVEGFNASASTKRLDKAREMGFVNKRAAAWWGMREALDPANDMNVALPPDNRLIGDLTAPHWKVMSGGKIQVESKDDIKSRLGRSPDEGDAVVMAFWPRSSGWADAYGVARCPKCREAFKLELHPLSCPHCRTQHDLQED